MCLVLKLEAQMGSTLASCVFASAFPLKQLLHLAFNAF